MPPTSRDIAIRVENLSKKYRLGQGGTPSAGLRHLVQSAATAPLRWIGAPQKKSPKTTQILDAAGGDFWALRDVTFDVAKGQVVGIIGRNGAGKSTLLKVLSRITEPTRGRIGIRGRMASLLEVGTGFHPELTGHENIYLNGAILGMSRSEITSKLDEISAFAGIERFLDTPVKRYSSGMYVRLAFAVAAHLEPEILVVDEVLAVGDAEFQKKCLGKMQEVSGAGRTVLFVSHNLPAVSLLCKSCIYLKSGRIELAGDVPTVLARYQGDFGEAIDGGHAPQYRRGTGSHRIERIEPSGGVFAAREPLVFRVSIKQHRDEGPFHIALHFRDKWDTEVFSIDTAYLDDGLLKPGNQELEIRIDSPWLFPGDFRIEAYLHIGGIVDHWPDACRFRVESDVAKFGYSLDSAKNKAHTLASFRVEAHPQG